MDWAAHLEHLQAVLKEFDSIAAPNKETLIRYFRKGLHPSIRAQLDNRGQDLDVLYKELEKAVDAEVKANLQPPFGTRKIDSRYPKGYRSLIKKDKNDAYWKHCDEASNKDKEKAKSYNPSFANQPQTQVSKKCHKIRQGGHLATGVNTTKIAKKDKDKDKAKDLSHIKCYTCKWKGHYANKYPEK